MPKMDTIGTSFADRKTQRIAHLLDGNIITAESWQITFGERQARPPG